MTQTKDKHYWTQLRSALTSGAWGSSAPAKAYNGTPTSWPELFRKFNKHNHGFTEVVEIASQTQALALQIAGGTADTDLDGDGRRRSGPLALDEECIVDEGRRDEARAGFETLKKLEAGSPKSDSLKLALAYYAYALGQPEECVQYILQVRDLADYQSRMDPASSVRTASTLQVPPSVAATTTSSTASFTGSFVTSDSTTTIADINDGKAWAMTELFRSVCLQGMSYEKTRSSPQTILQTYLPATQLLPALEADISRVSPTNPSNPASGHGHGRLDVPSFTRYRELWRWVERLLWRAIIIASHSCPLGSPDEQILFQLFTQYQSCSARWPPSFRSEHRATVSTLHLRALIIRSRLPGPPPLSSSSATSVRTTSSQETAAWLPIARRVVRDYRDVLTACTQFPKAGKRNVKVEEFVDLCVAVWEASGAAGEHAGWVIDVLWWATRLTFNSYRIFRHMSRLFAAAGDPELARRTLRLYATVVEKAREAGEESSDDADTDENWVMTLVDGARMLCRLALAEESGRDVRGIEDMREAGRMISKAKGRLGEGDGERERELRGSVMLAEGVWETVMAIKEQDHLTRPERLTNALALFESSISTHPTAQGYYHLALALSQAIPSRDLDRAIECARAAVEAEPTEMRYWHLLGLLLVMAEDWRGANTVLEVGAQIGEEGEGFGGVGGGVVAAAAVNGHVLGNGNGNEEADGTTTYSTATESSTVETNGGETITPSEAESTATATPTSHPPPSTNQPTRPPELPSTSIPLLDPDAADIPRASLLLAPLKGHPTPSRMEKFEQAVQLRMTELALAELREGAEGAGEKWVEVFGWFAERKGMVREHQQSQQTSMDTTRRSVEINIKVQTEGSEHHQRDTVHQTSDTYPGPALTITVASPGQADGQIVAVNGSERPSIGTDRPSLDGSVGSKDTTKEKGNAGKKMQKMLKNGVHQSHRRITTISKRIGHGVQKGGNLRRPNSTPNFQSLLSQQYQASSIHSRRQFSPFASTQDVTRPESPPPPPPPQSVPPRDRGERSKRERRMLSDLWLMSAATFRRSGKIEQARGAIQEAEVRDDENPGVWVQLGLYHMALNHPQRAIQAFQKALFISPDHIPATIHLCQVYLGLYTPSGFEPNTTHPAPKRDNIDLAAGLLSDLTKGVGWDCAEAWYFLGRANGLRGMRERERECLGYALGLAEGRPLRDLSVAVGWCL